MAPPGRRGVAPGQPGLNPVSEVDDVAHAMCEVSDRLVAHLGHICVGGVIAVTTVPLSPPLRRSIAENPDLVRQVVGAGDGYELGFAPPPDASPAIECLSPELPPITATGAIERKAGVRLVDAARKRAPTTAPGWQHF